MKKIIAFLFLIVLVLTGCVPASEPEQAKTLPPGQPPIGGQRDEHGCLGPAGYSWNETIGACVREWELNENQQKAAKTAVQHAGSDYATTIIGVEVARCPGCFTVRMEQGEGRTPRTIILEDWEVKSAPAADPGCEEAGGNWLAEYNECEFVDREWCEEAGGTFAECESACRHDPDAEICTMQCVPVCYF